MPIPKSKIPAFVRDCYERARKASKEQRDIENERLRFYVGGELQWRNAEIEKRKKSHSPIITINKCKPAVDQIEGDIRMNPPGPEVHPVGDGADKDTADIWAGIIREVEARSDGHAAYSIAGRHEAASGYGCLELATEYESDRSFNQRVKILPVQNPGEIYWDPASRTLNHRDASFAVRVKIYSRTEYIEAFGERRKVLQSRLVQQASGWIQDAIGYRGEMATVNEWTGGSNEGPFFVAEMYYVDMEDRKVRRYSDGIDRFDDDEIPAGVKPKQGDEWTRISPKRTIRKWVCDALELLDETEWPGQRIPWFPVLGPEIWIDGKLHRLSLIAPAIDPQRGLNYCASTAAQISGVSSKAPWIGYKGQFDDPKWASANHETWAYLEVMPKFATDSSTGQSQLLPFPQRNTWEAPIQWLLALSAYFSDSIKAVTSIYDPSLGAQRGDQSGKAIQQLRSESSVGNFSYVDNLHLVIGDLYQEIIDVSRVLLDGPRAITIVRPDSQHEIVRINQIFADGGIDPKSGKPGKPNNIVVGEHSARVTAGPSFQTRQDEAIEMLVEFFKTDPNVLATPGVAAKFLRIVGQGNPEVEAMADLLSPSPGEQSPEQSAQALQQAQGKLQQAQQVIQKLQQALLAKLPEIEARKYIAEINALAGIREAEIKAGIDKAQADEAALEHLTGMAHESAMQAVEHAHATGMQQAQANQAAQQQQQSGNEDPQQQ